MEKLYGQIKKTLYELLDGADKSGWVQEVALRHPSIEAVFTKKEGSNEWSACYEPRPVYWTEEGLNISHFIELCLKERNEKQVSMEA